MDITAAVAREPQAPFSFERLTLADPRPDEVLVEVRGVGVCHTDVGARDGVFPLAHPVVVGHEGSGVVIEVGSAVTKVAPGEKIGLIGRSGAGKSTLVNLLLRFFDCRGGRILIDGQDIAGVTQESLRASISMVTQDTSLLHRSIRDNIRYGRPDATEAEIAHAAELAHAADDFQLLRHRELHLGEHDPASGRRYSHRNTRWRRPDQIRRSVGSAYFRACATNQYGEVISGWRSFAEKTSFCRYFLINLLAA